MAVIVVNTPKVAAVKTAAMKYGIDVESFKNNPRKLELNGNKEKILSVLDEVGIFAYEQTG